MRLNLVNTPSLIGAGLSTIACGEFNPKFGNKVPVGEDLFKYVLSGPPKEVFMFERISLNELFEGLPQSIVGVVQRDWFEVPSDLHEAIKLDLTTRESPVDEQSVLETDELSQQFYLWTSYIGFGLLRSEVDLSTSDGWLHVDARRSVVFKGTVSIKVKEAE